MRSSEAETVALFVTHKSKSKSTVSAEEVCFDEHFEAHCAFGEFVQVTAAKYGRMTLGR